MAVKRMFSLKVVDEDAFLDLNASARCLYFELSVRADDDGFVTPKKIIRMTGASKKDYEALVDAGFIIDFESGVCCIRHWLSNNTIRKDCYTPSVYSERNMLEVVTIEGKEQYKLKENEEKAFDNATELEQLRNEDVTNPSRRDEDVTNPLQERNEDVTNPSPKDKDKEKNSTDSSLRSSSSLSRQNGPCESGIGDSSSGLFLAEAPEAAASPKSSDDQVFIDLPVFGKDRHGRDKTVPITEDFVSQMEAIYQACDVRQSIRNAVGWCLGNPKNRKKDWKRFLTSWLQRDNDRASPLPRAHDGTEGGSKPRDWDGSYEGASMTEVTI